MGRNIIIPKRRDSIPEVQGPVEVAAGDNYATQILKLIPAEIIGVYLGLQNLFSPLDASARFIAQVVIFIIILFLAPLYLRNTGGITDGRQRMVAIISFCIWSISLGGPFQYLLASVGSPVSAEIIGGALMMIYTLIVPMLYRKQ
jgi:hypothetical protein